MNMSKRNWALASTLALVQTACGGGGGGSSAADGMNSTLEGNWRTACSVNVEDSDYEQETLNIMQNEFTLTQSSFADQNCVEKEQETVISGTFTEGEPVTTSSQLDAMEIDLTLNAFALALFTESSVASANGAGLCGVTSWDVGVSVDVSNCSDISGTTAPAQLYDIYRIDAGQLYLGDNAGSTSSERPTTLDTDSGYQRVETSQGSDNGNTDGDGSDSVTLPEASLPLDADNALNVSRFAIYNYELLKGLTNAGNTGVLSGTGNSSGRVSGLYITSMCEGGGSATLNGTPAQLANLTADYADCVIDGRTFNGKMSLNFIVANGVLGDTASDWSYSAMASVDGFMISTTDREHSVEGEFVLTTVFTADTEIAGGAISRFQGIDDEVIFIREETEITRMMDFDLFFTYRTESPVVFSDGVDEARIASSIIGGQVSVFQSTPYSGFDLGKPFTGELEIFGANSTLIEIDAEEAETVIISVDADGNGSFTDSSDQVLTGAWAEFF